MTGRCPGDPRPLPSLALGLGEILQLSDHLMLKFALQWLSPAAPYQEGRFRAFMAVLLVSRAVGACGGPVPERGHPVTSHPKSAWCGNRGSRGSVPPVAGDSDAFHRHRGTRVPWGGGWSPLGDQQVGSAGPQPSAPPAAAGKEAGMELRAGAARAGDSVLPCKQQVNYLSDVLRLVRSSPAPLIRGNECCSVQ